MNIFKSKIKGYWISCISFFLMILLIILAFPKIVGIWGALVCLLYWVGFLFLYTRIYNDLKSSVKNRFPKIYPFIFNDKCSFKNKYVNLENWEYDKTTVEMYDYDLNIQKQYLKIKELDKFKYVVFALTIFIMIISILLCK